VDSIVNAVRKASEYRTLVGTVVEETEIGAVSLIVKLVEKCYHGVISTSEIYGRPESKRHPY
jgi:hypothetical protein